MSTTRRQFLHGSATFALANKIANPLMWARGLAAPSNQPAVPPYGSGNFGAWIEDEFGLPAFKYTLNQTEDPRAITDVRPGLLSSTEHVHQVGNDRITALASNYGHLRVRQDEGCPKFLNDVDPAFHQYAGDFGYLVDDDGELGAIWPSLNQSLIWALAGVDPAKAWKEWKRNTLACHAENYPDLWYGVWSGNDSYNTSLSKHPGAAADEPFFRGTDFPVLNLHAHACSLYSASKLLGIDFTVSGLKLNLQLPLEAYSFESPLVGIRRAGRRFEGWYEPSQPGTWTIEMKLPHDIAAAVPHIRVNAKASSTHRESNNILLLRGSGGPNRPLRWVLE